MPPAATQGPVEEEEQHAPRTPARHNLLPADAPDSAWKETLFAALRQYVVQCGGRAFLSSFCRDTSATLRPKKQRTIVRLIEESGPPCGSSVLTTGGKVELAVHLPAASAAPCETSATQCEALLAPRAAANSVASSAAGLPPHPAPPEAPTWPASSGDVYQRPRTGEAAVHPPLRAEPASAAAAAPCSTASVKDPRILAESACVEPEAGVALSPAPCPRRRACLDACSPIRAGSGSRCTHPCDKSAVAHARHCGVVRRVAACGRSYTPGLRQGAGLLGPWQQRLRA